MADGRELEIRHPDAVAWDEGEKRIVLVVSKGEHWWIDIALSTALVEPIPAEPVEPGGTPE